MASERVMKSAVFVFVFVSCIVSYADSVFFEPVSGYSTNDILTNVALDGYDTYGDNVICWSDGGLKIFNKDGTQIRDLSNPSGYQNYWNNFVKIDPSGNSAWVGMSVSDNTDDRIYQVDLDTGAWTYKATVGGNFDVDFQGSNVYVSALDETLQWGTASIWLMDTSGSNDHDLIASIGGYSAGLAIDMSGNLYYGTNGIATGDSLVKFTSAQLAGAVGSASLELSDAIVLSSIDGGAYDADVDDAGNIVFSANGNSAYAAVWNGNMGNGFIYNLLGSGKGLVHWFCNIDCQGDLTSYGTFYQSDFYYDGLAEVTVPEPASLLLIALPALWLRRRHR